MQNRLVGPLVGMSLLVGACTYGEYDPAQSPTIDAPQAEVPEGTQIESEVPTTAVPAELGSLFRTFMHEQAPINIIYVPSSTLATMDVPASYAEYIERNRALLQAQDPTMLSRIQRSVTEATDGRYVPSAVTVTEAQPLLFDSDCVANSNVVNDNIRTHIGGSLLKGHLNIAYVDAPSCGDFAGFASPDNVPILLKSSLLHIGLVLPHEVGHSAGLGHSGEIVCAPATVPIDTNTCNVQPENDKASIMSQFDFSPALPAQPSFTAPELAMLGMLQPHEIIEQPGDGEYTIVSTDAMDDVLTPKVLRVQAEGADMFVSIEHDVSAAGEAQYSLQIRASAKDPDLQTFGVVKPAAHLAAGVENASMGIIAPEALLYEDAIVKVTLVEVFQTAARVRITNK